MRKKKQDSLTPFYIALAIIALLIFVTISPAVNQTIGNMFFGRIKPLYNVNLAQYFYTNAAYPLIGTSAPFSHYQLSRTYFIQGHLDSAVWEIQKELELYPENTRSYYVMGLTYGYLNEEEKAIEAFSKFIELNPINWAARNDKAWLQFRLGDINGALDTIEPVAHDTKNAWVQNTYGTLLMNKKKYGEAKQAFKYALQDVSSMTEEDWGIAYPGNDPRIYGTGLAAMKTSIQSNLKLLSEKGSR